MRIIQIALLLLISNTFAQANKDLYITYDDNYLKNRIASSDKNSSVEVYQFQIQNNNSNENILVFDKDGNLQVQVLVNGMPFPSFKFTYTNQNGDNPEKKISGREIKNIIDFREIEKLTDANNFYDTMKLFENIYLVYLKSNTTELTAKKVKFERVSGL